MEQEYKLLIIVLFLIARWLFYVLFETKVEREEA